MSNTPKIRFEKYTGDWENRKLGGVATYFNGGSFENDVSDEGMFELVTLKSVDMNGRLVNSGRFVNVEVPTLKKGTLIMILSEQSPGLLGMTAQIPINNRYILNQRVAEIRPLETINSTFLSMAINRNQQYFSKCGAGTKVQNISKPNVENFEFLCPSLDEQLGIGVYFTNLDNLITLHQREIAKVINLKQTMLISMFPSQKKERPEIRFEGFGDNWTSIEFGKLFRKLKNNTFSRDMLNYDGGTVKDIHYGDVLIKYGFWVDCSSDEVPFINTFIDASRFVTDSFLQAGDIVIADTAEDTTAGKVVEIRNTGISVLGGQHTYPCRPIICFEAGFLGILLNTPYFHDQLIKYMQGTKVTSINYDMLCKALVSYPSKDEQKKIVSFFDTLDGLIKSKEASLRKLVNLKQQLLNKMFA